MCVAERDAGCDTERVAVETSRIALVLMCNVIHRERKSESERKREQEQEREREQDRVRE